MKTSQPADFIEKTFPITKDVNITAMVAYIQGHPIVKTKTVVLSYQGQVFRASQNHTTFTERLIKDITDPIYVVELMNYLSRNINGSNLFEIYNKEPKVPKTLCEATFGEEANGGAAPPFDKSIYIKGLIVHRQFVKTALMETLSSNFSCVFKTLETLSYVPIYGYITESGVLSRNAEPILHLAVVFTVLSHQKRFPEISNQEAIASFNVIMEAEQTQLTMEILNKKTLAYQIERKRAWKQAFVDEKAAHAKTQEKLDKVIEQNAELLLSNRNLASDLNEARNDIDTLINMQKESNEKLRIENMKMDHMSAQLSLMSTRLETQQNDVRLLVHSSKRVSKEISNISIANHSTGHVRFYLYFYLSDSISKNRAKRELPYEETWLGCGCGEKKCVKSRFPGDAIVLYKREINSRDVYEFIIEHTNENFIIERNYRHVRVKIAQVGAFFNFIDKLLDSQSRHESVRKLERLEKYAQKRQQLMQNAERVLAETEAIKREAEELELRKRELREKYNDLHIIVSGWRRKVYDDWTIRFGRNGSQTRALTRDELLSDRFTNDGDSRIRYE